MHALRRLLHALAAIGLLTAGSLVAIGVLASSGCACSKRGAYVAAMKADLRNLATAQDARRAREKEFGGGLAELDLEDDVYAPSQGVGIVIEYADSVRWRARATHYALGPSDSCTIEGRVPASSSETELTTIQCTPKSCTIRGRDRGLDAMLLRGLFLEFAFLFMSGAWRQMRRALESS